MLGNCTNCNDSSRHSLRWRLILDELVRCILFGVRKSNLGILEITSVRFTLCIFQLCCVMQSKLELFFGPCRWKPGCTRKTKQRFQKLFRHWQIFLILENEQVAYITLAVYWGTCFVSSSLVYIIIKFQHRWNIIMTSYTYCILFAVVTLSFILFKLSINISTNSIAWWKSFERNDLTRSKLEVMLWRSCPSLELRAGNLFTFGSAQFLLKTYGCIILEYSINLLIAYP